jgi:FkbM family methyltransferase
VVSTTIDDLVKSCGLKKINFIKMDIEGCEFSALKGAKKNT